MTKRMIIDASHREETRVVVLDGQKVEEFDFESAAKRPLKGNIYLAKVTRVEPSLQAAFVEYGGNRQGFLAFAEIHPDYYQIPIADRQALLAEQEADARRRAEEEDFEAIDTASAPAQESAAETAALSEEGNQGEAHLDHFHDETGLHAGSEAEFQESEHHHEHDSFAAEDAHPDGHPADEESPAPHHEDAAAGTEEAGASGTHGGEGEADRQMKQRAQRPAQRWTRRRHYKIQEVIKRRQVLLVQVVKEERGNKGAALTTYLSLAGRYCVLMPNTPRGGGISRKITSAADRNRLKSAAQSLELPEGMGLIIRTAGENRTKVEIKRDYEYLLRMWDTIRELTLKSNAPACVYEEGDLIKRAIRDLYNKDVSEIVVEGEDGYRNAKDFMRMLMPSHAKNVKPYKETMPLFQRYQIEAQLDAMFMPTVTLKSGGYIVINQTEALVSIDVNSGKATREHSIEDTAYKTNLEAADEIGRQLRLRDLAGLIVIDFIDMEDSRNDRNVEKRLRDCVKNDRARVQIGKISQFGLLEMSRQRLRAGVVAGSTVPCPHCGGQGIVRSVESTTLRLLRGLEEEAQRQRAAALKVRTPTEVAIYALNHKRREIAHVESEYGIFIQFEPNETIVAGTFEIDRIGSRPVEERPKAAAMEMLPAPLPVSEPDEPEESDEPVAAPEEHPAPESQAAAQNGSKRRRRRRRGRDRERAPLSGNAPANGSAPAQLAMTERDPIAAEEHVPEQQSLLAHSAVPAEHPATGEAHAGTEAGAPRKRRRRRRGRRNTRENGSLPLSEGHVGGHEASPSEKSGTEAAEPESGHDVALHAPHLPATAVIPNAPSEPVWSLAPSEHHIAVRAERPRETEKRASFAAETREKPVEPEEPAREKPAALRAETHEEPEEPQEPVSPAPAAEPSKPEEPAGPPRKGWWQRPFRAK